MSEDNQIDKLDFGDSSIKCKVVLLGESGVGKTSIISRYTTNIFKDSLMTTPGANFITKKVEFKVKTVTSREKVSNQCVQLWVRELQTTKKIKVAMRPALRRPYKL